MSDPDPIQRLNAALEGRYRVESELGEGGMATVYLADDIKHERKVALKVLKPELAAIVGAERFLTEIKTTANPLRPTRASPFLSRMQLLRTSYVDRGLIFARNTGAPLDSHNLISHDDGGGHRPPRSSQCDLGIEPTELSAGGLEAADQHHATG